MITFDEPPGRKIPDVPFVDKYIGTRLPKADTFRVLRCPNTAHAHIVLFDAHDVPFAQFTVGPDNVEHIVATCESVFAMPRKQ